MKNYKLLYIVLLLASFKLPIFGSRSFALENTNSSVVSTTITPEKSSSGFLKFTRKVLRQGLVIATSFFTATLIHEAGHYAVGKKLDMELSSFKPYPHKHDGQWIAGGVELVDRPEYPKNHKIAFFAAGSLASAASVLVLAPIVPMLPEGFTKDVLEEVVDFQSADFMLYALVDSFTESNGDWHKISQLTGLEGSGKYVILATATASWYILRKYKNFFKDRMTKRKLENLLKNPKVIKLLEEG